MIIAFRCRIDAPTRAQSIRFLKYEKTYHGHQQDTNVEPQRPIFNIPKIVLDALLHHAELWRFPTVAVDLGPASDARLHLMSNGISSDQPIVFVIMRKRVWAWAHQGHVSAQHVEK